MAKRTGSKPAAPNRPHVPPHPDPKDPDHGEWRIDEASDESFPASDPSQPAMPHRKPPPAK